MGVGAQADSAGVGRPIVNARPDNLDPAIATPSRDCAYESLKRVVRDRARRRPMK